MTYVKQLPRTGQLLALAHQITFPASQAEIISIAKSLGYGASLINFIRLFDGDEVFSSTDDFMNRCEELELLIGEEKKAPVEYLRSYQD